MAMHTLKEVNPQISRSGALGHAKSITGGLMAHVDISKRRRSTVVPSTNLLYNRQLEAVKQISSLHKSSTLGARTSLRSSAAGLAVYDVFYLRKAVRTRMAEHGNRMEVEREERVEEESRNLDRILDKEPTPSTGTFRIAELRVRDQMRG